jgi:hypothetical protein
MPIKILMTASPTNRRTKTKASNNTRYMTSMNMIYVMFESNTWNKFKGCPFNFLHSVESFALSAFMFSFSAVTSIVIMAIEKEINIAIAPICTLTKSLKTSAISTRLGVPRIDAGISLNKANKTITHDIAGTTNFVHSLFRVRK